MAPGPVRLHVLHPHVQCSFGGELFLSITTMETWVKDELRASFRKSTHTEELFLGVNVLTEENFILICQDPENLLSIYAKLLMVGTMSFSRERLLDLNILLL